VAFDVCGLSTCIESVASVQGYRAELVIWKLSANERRSPNVNTFSKIQREIAKETAVRRHGFGEQNALTIRTT
jgi:hypothetical protein